jgi:hypothetical protein
MKRLLSHRGNATEAFASALGTAIAFGESIYSNSQEFVISSDACHTAFNVRHCDVDSARDIYVEWTQGFMEACSMDGDYGVRIRLATTRGKVIVDVVRF